MGIAGLIIGLSLVIALLGKNRKLGFWGYLFFSLLFTPILGFIVLLASDKKRDDDGR